jgi:predicted MFS family arabinose efflux permease
MTGQEVTIQRIAHSETSIVVFGALLSIASTGTNYVLPDYLLGMQVHYGLSVGQLGFIPGGENLAIGIGCIATGLFLRQVHARALFAAAIVCVLGNLACLVARDFVSIFALRVIIGLAGEGPLYAICYMVVGCARNTDRALGVAITSVGLFGASILVSESSLIKWFGTSAMLAPFAILSAVTLGWLVLDRSIGQLGSRAGDHAKNGDAKRGIDRGALAIIVSISLLTAVECSSWDFISTAAQAAGARPDDIASALSAGIVLGLAGSIVPAIIGNRFGRILPIVLCSVGLVIACALAVSGQTFLHVAVASMVLQFCWGMNIVYQMSGLVARDGGGRYTTFGAVSQMAGLALGPPVFGTFIGSFGYVNLPVLVAAGALPGMALFVLGSIAPSVKIGMITSVGQPPK